MNNGLNFQVAGYNAIDNTFLVTAELWIEGKLYHTFQPTWLSHDDAFQIEFQDFGPGDIDGVEEIEKEIL